MAELVDVTTPKGLNKYRVLLNEVEFIKLCLARWISRFGDAIDTIAFAWLVYELTGSSVLMATLYGVNSIPSIVFGLISGPLVSYIPKKTMTFVCDLGRALGVGLIALLFMTGHLAIWHLFIITFLNSVFEALRAPASIMLTKLTLKDTLMDLGVSLDNAIGNAIELTGMAIAAVLIGLFGLGGCIIIDAATFAICGGIILSLKVVGDTVKKEKLELKGYATEFSEGLKYFSSNKLIFSMGIVGAAVMLLLVPYNSLISAFVGEVLQWGPEGLSALGIALTMGMILGGVIYAPLCEHVKNKTVFITGLSMLGSCYFLLGTSGGLAISKLAIILIAFIMGIGIPLFSIPINIAFMNKIEEEYIARVASLYNTLVLCVTPVGSMITGILCGIAPLKSIYMISGAIILLLGVTQILNKSLNEL